MIIELIDGSLGGGNTAELLRKVSNILQEQKVPIGEINLLDCVIRKQLNYSLFERLRVADAWVIGTGTYWDSWGLSGSLPGRVLQIY
jgi:multimeric flavodoxin WrbA